MQVSSRRLRRRLPGLLRREPAARLLARRQLRPRLLPACRRHPPRRPCMCPRCLAAARCRMLARGLLQGSRCLPMAQCCSPTGQHLLLCQQRPTRTGCRAPVWALQQQRMAGSSAWAVARLLWVLRPSGPGWTMERHRRLLRLQAGCKCGSDGMCRQALKHIICCDGMYLCKVLKPCCFSGTVTPMKHLREDGPRSCAQTRARQAL